MGCQTDVTIGNNLVFSICTHDPDTGVLTDADSAPQYRIYEDETATAILTGNMAKLDDANTTGFYTELIACTSGNGFEDGKTYTIYIEATVDSDTGGISYGFTASTFVDLVWDEVMDGNAPANCNTAREYMNVLISGTAGKSAETGDWSARDLGDTKIRVQGTLSSTGVRESIEILDGT